MVKKYKIICNEGTDFCSWTEEKPQTKKQIIKRFYSIGKSNEGFETKKKDYTLGYIQDIWNVTIEEVK